MRIAKLFGIFRIFRTFRIFGILGILMAMTITAKATTKVGPDPDKIIEACDKIRNPSGPFVMEVEVQTQGNNENSVFEVFIKDRTKTLIKTLAPERDKGRNLLMLGENMWAYIPNLKRAVRVALAQKLSGQAANGDIGRMSWSGDYKASLEKQDDKELVLFLQSNKEGLTYDKLRVFVAKENHRPLRAEYLTVTGKTLKYASFENYKKLGGEERPSEIHITDALNKDGKSVIYIRKMQEKDLPSSMFNQKSLE